MERIYDSIGVNAGVVVDPFMGSAVTGTAARARGLDFVGIEAHPLIASLARAKLHVLVTAAEIRASADAICRRSMAKIADSSIDERRAACQNETNLIKRSFDPTVLHQLIVVRDEIILCETEGVARYLQWALLGTLRDVAHVKVGWPYQRPALRRQPRSSDVTGRFLGRIDAIASDIAGLSPSTTHATILAGDSSARETWAAWAATGTASVSSPPYLNNFDYADATRLEMYFWGMARTWKELCERARKDMLTATTQQSSKPAMEQAIEQIDQLGSASAEVKDLTGQLTEERRARGTRAKQYDQVIPVYFLQMQMVLRNMAEKLQSGARCAWLIGDSAPYGVYIDTPRLIGELAEGEGYRVRADSLLRKRGHRWVASGQRHQVELGERLLVFERTA